MPSTSPSDSLFSSSGSAFLLPQFVSQFQGLGFTHHVPLRSGKPAEKVTAVSLGLNSIGELSILSLQFQRAHKQRRIGD